MVKRILAIDTSTDACSVAIWNQGEILTSYEVRPREHAQRILPMVQQALAEGEIVLSQIDVLAFGRGPGSFTGIRIGISVAQGLALGADLPLLGLSTLKTIAQGAWRISHAERILAAIDARMGEVYWGQFERQKDSSWHENEREEMITFSEALKRLRGLRGIWARAGTGWQMYPDLVSESAFSVYDGKILFPQAEDMLSLALLAWKQGLALAVENVKPIYLHNKVTWKKQTSLL